MTEVTDTQKLKVAQLTDQVKEIYQLVVTGNPQTNQPSLLEMFRSMAKDIEDIKNDRRKIANLEKRVELIEERHTLIDEQKRRINEQKKRWNAYELLIVGTLISNIATLIMWALGIGK